MVEFSAFRDAFAALPCGPLALDDVRTPEFVIHEDRRVVAYYAPFGCLTGMRPWLGGRHTWPNPRC